MSSKSSTTAPRAPDTVGKRRQRKPYLDWFFGCIAFSLISVVAGMAQFEAFAEECFLCHEDIGWTLVVIAYATPGLAVGSAIWAVMWMQRFWRESKRELIKPVLVVLFVAVALLVANVQFFYAIPAAKTDLPIDPALMESIVMVTASVNPYTHPDEPQGSARGTGIVVDSERGWVVTNAHVTNRVPTEIAFQLSADPSAESYPAKKLYVDPYLDLAILQWPQAHLPSQLPSLPLECEGNSTQDIVALGYAGAQRVRLIITEGERIAPRVWSGRTWFRALADYQHGMSGGPTIDLKSGRVVGITTLGTTGNLDYETGFTVPARYVCRILDLLRMGYDPTPSRIPLTFYDNLSTAGELVIAEVDRSTGDVPLIEGDTILGVKGIDNTVASESELINVLRGVSYPVKLRIIRNGIEQLVSVSFGKMEHRSRRSLLYVSGYVIGESEPWTGIADGMRKRLKIRLADPGVDDGSDGLSFDEYTSYVIVSVDGMIFDDVGSMHRYLAGAQRTNQKAVLKLREEHTHAAGPSAYQRLALVPRSLRLIQ
jgi:serine protease Do